MLWDISPPPFSPPPIVTLPIASRVSWMHGRVLFTAVRAQKDHVLESNSGISRISDVGLDRKSRMPAEVVGPIDAFGKLRASAVARSTRCWLGVEGRGMVGVAARSTREKRLCGPVFQRNTEQDD